MRRHLLFWLVAVLPLTSAAPLFAQSAISIPGYDIKALTQDRLDEDHGLLLSGVELTQGDTSLYADEVEVFEGQDRVLARGNVLLVQGNNRIAADRAEFNTKTHLGTFYRASGMATVQPPRTMPQPGAIAVPTMVGQTTDVVFFGEVIEKVGNKKYKITNGGFSACEQPTPRWNLSAGSVVLNVDHYTILRNAIFKVKDVPMLYTPILYFPTKEDGRATGFLIPTYGMSFLRGQTIHNAFFWAMSRWQDATFLYDWFSKTGTGGGGEYRFNRGGGTDGQLSVYRLDERTASYELSNGATTSVPAQKSFTVNSNANTIFPFNLRARARVNYFSSITSNQTFQTNINIAAVNTRYYGGNIVGSWGSYALNTQFDHNEYFPTTTQSYVTGGAPKIMLTRGERPLFSKTSPVYFSVSEEIAHFDYFAKEGDVVAADRSVGRSDFLTTIRYPFKKWQWFTVNSAVSWRDTAYTRSLDPETVGPGRVGVPIGANLNRQFATVSAQSSGPIFTRVWNTPDNGYAERFKHTIEPTFGIARTSSIDQVTQILVTDAIDQIYGDTTTVNYGISNRVYAKRKVGSTSQAQQIVVVDLFQSYYSDPRQSIVDPHYSTTNTPNLSTTAPSKFSSVTLNVRATPSTATDTALHLEFDSKYKELRQLSATTGYNWTGRIQTSTTWSKKFFIRELGGFNDPAQLDNAISFNTNAHTLTNKYGANYSLNYDVLHSRFIQERFTAFYNAQCCGVAFEYQKYNLQGLTTIGVPSDRRFFFSFTLAGLGNFSPFNGGLSGVPR
jgi:LPS-assembly protein